MLFWESEICQLKHVIYRVKNMSFGAFKTGHLQRLKHYI